MCNKQQEERYLTMRFLHSIGRGDTVLEIGDRPDVIALIDGMRIGIEETKFHSDEQMENTGSALRNQEEKTARLNPNSSYTTAGVIDPLPALIARISDKTTIASGYDTSQFDQLWLLISGQIPKLGAVTATFAIPQFVNIAALNETTHEILRNSSFSAVHFHLIMSHTVFTWSKETKWYQSVPCGHLNEEIETLEHISHEHIDNPIKNWEKLRENPEFVENPYGWAKRETLKILTNNSAIRR